MIDRRRFTALSLAAASAPFLPARSARASQRTESIFEWSVLGERVYLAEGGGGNAIYISGEGGAILVDTKNAGLGDPLKREAESRGPSITLTINTHHHGDHTGGNYAFTSGAGGMGGAGAPLVAHTSAKPRIESQTARYINGLRAAIQSGPTDEMKREAEARLEQLDSTPGAWLPSKTVSLGAHPIESGGRTIIAHHIGNGHTDNDLIVHLEDENLIHFGDLIFNGLHPFCDVNAQVSIRGWIASLMRGMEMADEKTIVVPGHGPVTDRAGIRAQIDYFEQLLENVSAQIELGKSRDEVTEMAFGFMDGLGFERLRPIAIGVVYDQLTRE